MSAALCDHLEDQEGDGCGSRSRVRHSRLSMVRSGVCDLRPKWRLESCCCLTSQNTKKSPELRRCDRHYNRPKQFKLAHMGINVSIQVSINMSVCRFYAHVYTQVYGTDVRATNRRRHYCTRAARADTTGPAEPRQQPLEPSIGPCPRPKAVPGPCMHPHTHATTRSRMHAHTHAYAHARTHARTYVRVQW